jgi:hypothetical protein
MENADTNRRTDWADSADGNGFFGFGEKKSVSICRIRPIRSPIVSAFSKTKQIQIRFTQQWKN